MSLTLGEQKCINCREHIFKDEEFEGEPLRQTRKRGSFKIETNCPRCTARMALIIWKDTPYNNLPTWNSKSYAIAYACTENDEPCYKEECSECTGNGKGWWEE